jgi:hypothetical protein
MNTKSLYYLSFYVRVSHSDDCEIYCVLGCDAMQSGINLLTFPRNLQSKPWMYEIIQHDMLET